MTTITIEVPDELAIQLDPQTMSMLVRELVTRQTARQLTRGADAQQPVPIYREITAFLASSPVTEQIVAFKISSVAQDRLEYLLDTQREAMLSPEEAAELDTYLQLSDWLAILKARARTGKPLLG